MKRTWIYTVLSIMLVLGTALIAFPAAIQSVAGLAVAQTSTKWNSVRDIAQGQNAITNGVADVAVCLWNGTTCDIQRGSITGGALVSQATSGTAFFAVTRADITTASVNLAFAFTSKKVSVQASINNTDDLCIDWLGATAVCAAANTAGDARLIAGQTIILDDYAVASLSVIAASGTQRVSVTAWQ